MVTLQTHKIKEFDKFKLVDIKIVYFTVTICKVSRGDIDIFSNGDGHKMVNLAACYYCKTIYDPFSFN